ncbi:MAG TPA: hypothetical protein VGJ01_21305 [Pseudolabrys sp.]|jgi:hypothetical protein
MRIDVEPIRPKAATTGKTRASRAADARDHDDDEKTEVKRVAPPPGLGQFVDKSA